MESPYGDIEAISPTEVGGSTNISSILLGVDPNRLEHCHQSRYFHLVDLVQY